MLLGTLPSQLYPVDDDRNKDLNLGVKLLSSVLAVSLSLYKLSCVESLSGSYLNAYSSHQKPFSGN